MSDYYDREKTIHTDGTPFYKTEEDVKNEALVVAALQQAWKCELREFGKMAAIDWYALRHGRMIALLELKSRTHASDTHQTVFLNVRKWLALTLGCAGLGCPSFFVVKFTDGIFWIPVVEIDATKHKIGGLKEIKKSVNDIEPVIEVPVSTMRRLADPPDTRTDAERAGYPNGFVGHDAEGNFVHFCQCGKSAGNGHDVRLAHDQLGTWYCAEHDPG